MNSMLNILAPQSSVRLAWTLVHFAWQGAAIAAAYAAVVELGGLRAAAARYHAACLAMALMILAPILTYGWLASEAGPAGSLSASLAAPAPAASLLPATAAPSLRWFNAVVAGWLAGVALLSVRLAMSWAQAQRLRTRGTKPLGEPWLARCDKLRERLAIARPVKLLESATAHVPMVIGWMRPVILVPASTLAGLSPEQLDHILAHELAHIRRHDYLVNLFQCVVEALLFYHPAVWWISSQIRIEREHCCDDLGASVAGDRLTLARALGLLAEHAASTPDLAFAADGGSVLERIERLAGSPPETSDRRKKLAGGTLLVAVLLGAGAFAARPLLTSKLYVASAKLLLAHPAPNTGTAGDTIEYLAMTETERLQSDKVLGDAIQILGLEKRWGFKASQKHENLPEALALLRTHTSVQHTPGSPLLVLRVASTNALEAAEIANQIVQCYREWRHNEAQHAVDRQTDIISRSIEEVGQRMTRLLNQLADLASMPHDANWEASYQALVDEKAILQEERSAWRRKLIENRSASEPAQTLTSLDPATPPIKPTRWAQ